MKRTIGTIVLFLGILLAIGTMTAFAAIVAEVGSDGSITLEDGKVVSLAGVEMDAEGASILRVLAKKQDIQIEILQSLQDEKGRDCVYAYLDTKSISLPLMFPLYLM